MLHTLYTENKISRLALLCCCC